MSANQNTILNDPNHEYISSNNQHMSSLADILFKAQSRIEEAKQQQGFMEPIPLPKLSDEDDEYELGESKITSSRATSNDLFATFHKSNNNSIPVITAAEAYRILTGISEFKSLMDACQKNIVNSIEECKNIVTYHVSNLMSKEDVAHFVSNLESNGYTVLQNNANNSFTINWHNQHTKNLDESQLIEIIQYSNNETKAQTDSREQSSRQATIETSGQTSRQAITETSRQATNEATSIISAYEACLREIQRDKLYIITQTTYIENLVQQDIQKCLQNKRPNSCFIFQVPIGQVLNNSPNRKHHLKLLTQAFVNVLFTVTEKWHYKISDIENSHTRMKFKLSMPGFNQTNPQGSSAGINSIISNKLATPLSAFSNDYVANPAHNKQNSYYFQGVDKFHSNVASLQTDITSQLRQMKRERLEQRAKTLFSDLLVVMQQYVTLTHVKIDPTNRDLMDRLHHKNEQFEQIQAELLRLILDQQ